MKRLLVVLALIAALGVPLLAVDFASYQDGFQTFADSVANALPFNSSIGLAWSDAHIGQFPHFGAGLTLGATLIPYEGINAVAQMLGIGDLAGTFGIPEMEKWGVPLPAYTAEARLGGFGIPFDVGIKAGYLPPEALNFLPANWQNMSANYLLLGADARFAVLEERGLLPEISVGGGYNYMSGDFGFSGILGGNQDVDLSAVNPALNNWWLRVTDPDVGFEWQANVVDLKAQASKSLLFFTFYAGAGASFSMLSSAGGGLYSDVLLSTTGAGGPYSAITQPQMQQIEDLTGMEVTPGGFVVIGQKANGWGFRAFGGVSLDLWVLRIDALGMYNITSNTFGASVNARIQL